LINAFLLAAVAVVLAETGDKTQLLAMAFATKFRWQTVLWAVFAAASSFIVFALWTIRGDKFDEEERGHGRSPFINTYQKNWSSGLLQVALLVLAW
jgi:putative Ca2+/H+ antiporter (TMEM165/GDT1 family)